MMPPAMRSRLTETDSARAHAGEVLAGGRAPPPLPLPRTTPRGIMRQ